jgi:hypothetical protein
VTTPTPTHFVDHVLELGLGGVLAERAHDGAELLGGDGSIAVLVKEREGLLELWGGVSVSATARVRAVGSVPGSGRESWEAVEPRLSGGRCIQLLNQEAG